MSTFRVTYRTASSVGHVEVGQWDRKVEMMPSTHHQLRNSLWLIRWYSIVILLCGIDFILKMFIYYNKTNYKCREVCKSLTSFLKSSQLWSNLTLVSLHPNILQWWTFVINKSKHLIDKPHQWRLTAQTF